MLILRVSLGLTLLWFGALKLFTSGDGLIILQQALPVSLAFSQLFSFFVAFLEITLGLSMLLARFTKVASLVSFVYFLISAALIILSQGFDPRFPVLSTAGESALKNLTLAAGTLVLLSEKKSSNSDRYKDSKDPISKSTDTV